MTSSHSNKSQPVRTGWDLLLQKFSGCLSGLVDVGPGQLFQGQFILVIGQGGIENVDDIQLGNSGRHGTAAENGFIGGGVELLVCQLRHGRIHAPGDGDDRRLILLQTLHTLDYLHRGAGIGDHNAQVLRGSIPGLENLGVPVFIDNADLVEAEKFQVSILAGTQGKNNIPSGINKLLFSFFSELIFLTIVSLFCNNSSTEIRNLLLIFRVISRLG